MVRMAHKVVVAFVFASVVFAAGVPSHVKTLSGEWYTPRHPVLFDSRVPRREWFSEVFLEALAGGEEGLRKIFVKEHPDVDVYSFPFIQPSFAAMLLEEARHFSASGLKNPKPNGMNNYGIFWNHVGLNDLFQEFQREYVLPVARLLYPQLGGAQLDYQHTYNVHYSIEKDQHGLDVHHDSCDITLNVALQEPSEYSGSGLRFCGLYGTQTYRNYSFTYKHSLGRAILYDGRIRHGAEEIRVGERTNLVMWSHTSSYRDTAAYKRNNRGAHLMDGKADLRCVSYHHDADYCSYELPGYETRCGSRGENVYMPAWRKALSDDSYWQVQGTVVDVAGKLKAGTAGMKRHEL